MQKIISRIWPETIIIGQDNFDLSNKEKFALIHEPGCDYPNITMYAALYSLSSTFGVYISPEIHELERRIKTHKDYPVIHEYVDEWQRLYSLYSRSQETPIRPYHYQYPL